MLIQTVDRSIDAIGSSLYVGILQALSKAVFEVAQFDDQAFRVGEASPEVNRPEATLTSS